MKPATIRSADPDRDAAACLAIYAPFVESGAAGERGRGHGRALYAELADRLRSQRFHVACAGITLPNPASVALHERVGFVPVGTYRRIGWKDGAWHDVDWWQLELQAPSDGPPDEPLPPSQR